MSCDGNIVFCYGTFVLCDGNIVLCDGYIVFGHGTVVLCDGNIVSCDVILFHVIVLWLNIISDIVFEILQCTKKNSIPHNLT